MTSPDVLGSGGPVAAPAADRAPALPTGRGIELVLLAFAAVIVTGALVLVEANQEEELKVQFGAGQAESAGPIMRPPPFTV